MKFGIYGQFLQPENIEDIILTFDVSKFDKSNEVSFEHSKNIEDILKSPEVLKLDKFNENNDEQL